MGRQRRKKKARWRMRRGSGRKAVFPSRGRLRFDLTALEIAKGHDGLLRGAPEPIILAGIYVADQDAMQLRARAIWRFAPPNQFPCTVEPTEDSETIVPVMLDSKTQVVLVCVALEQDNGRGVQNVYADLERADALSAWSPRSCVPAPIPLIEIGTGTEAWTTPTPVELMFDGQPLADRCIGDKTIGASVLAVSPRANLQPRIRFVSEDQRNDWTAALRIRRT